MALTCLLNSMNGGQARISPFLRKPPALEFGSRIIHRAVTFGFGVGNSLESLLSAVHPPEDKAAMNLSCGERQM